MAGTPGTFFDIRLEDLEEQVRTRQSYMGKNGDRNIE